MIVKRILYHPRFVVELRDLAPNTRARAVKTERLFRNDPLHPSLRLHPLKGRLKGLWSLSVTMSIRILFERMPNGDINFYSIGHHDIYKNL